MPCHMSFCGVYFMSLIFLWCVFQAEAEMRQKMLLIQQIRAMEATPVIRSKLVDLTSTAGHGLLSEMSIAEVGWHYLQ